MKIQDTPRVGRLGRAVAYQSPYGLCLRELVTPRDTFSPARQFMRAAFGHHSEVFSHRLTDEQLDRWALVASQVMTHPSLGQYGPMSPQQLYTSINSVRSRVNLPETLEPPTPVTFGPSPVGNLVIEQSEAGVRLLLPITGELKEDVMVFGQAPCNSGRSKRRNVAYLGLVPPPVNGFSEVTYLYKARYGQPKPNSRVFIVTCQQKDGWKGLERVTHARVPERPKLEQAPAPLAPGQNPHMHKGSTRAAQGIQGSAHSQYQAGTKPVVGGEKAAGTAIRGDGGVRAGPNGTG